MIESHSNGKFLRSRLLGVAVIRKLAVCAAVFLGLTSADAKTVYVNAAQVTSGNGTSWSQAFTFLQDALAVAVAGDSVFVAKGTYYPDDGANTVFGDREETFTLLGQVTLYGGFAGTETDPNQRDADLNATILSGAIWAGVGQEMYRSLHVVTLAGSATLNGVTVERGNANGELAPSNQGGGCLAPAGTILTLVNCKISNNHAYASGGAVWGTVVATDTTFNNNLVSANIASPLTTYLYFPHLFVTDFAGGAITGNVTATNCTFRANSIVATPNERTNLTTSTASGGAISGNATLNNCVFDANTISATGVDSVSSGGAISGAVIAKHTTFTANTITAGSVNSGGAVMGQINAVNCTFATCTAPTSTPPNNNIIVGGGGAIFSRSISSLTNCVFNRNSCAYRGGAVHVEASSTDVPSTMTIASSTFVDNISTRGASLTCGGKALVFSNIFWDTGSAAVNMIHILGTQGGPWGAGYISSELFPNPTTETKNIVKLGITSVTRDPGGDIRFGIPSATLITTTPSFVNGALPVGADGLWRTADDGLRILAASSAIGQGHLDFLPLDSQDLDEDTVTNEPVPADIAGFRRVQDTTLDLGAYEFGNILHSPDISVENPNAVVLTSNVSNVNFSAFRGIARSFVIKNLGTTPLRRIVISGSGADIANFTFSQPAVNTVAPGTSTTFTVIFYQNEARVHNARLRITSNDLNETPFLINLTGNSPLPDIRIEHPTNTPLTDGLSVIDYGAVGSLTSLTKTFTIRNSGAGNLTILNISASGGNSDNFIPSAAAKTVIPSGDFTTFDVVFKPKGAGARNSTIVVQSTDPSADSSFDIKVTGSGIGAPEMVLSQSLSSEIATGATVGFGNVQKGLLHTKTFTIKNSGSAKLNSLAVTLSGSSNFTRTKLAVTSVDEGGNTKFTVTFKPGSLGKKTATLTVKSNDADESTIVVNLTGTGISQSAAKKIAKKAKQASLAKALSAPSQRGTGGEVSVIKESDGLKYLVLTLEKPANGSLEKQTVQVSSNLLDWFSGAKHTTTLVNNRSVLQVRDNTPVKKGEKRYIRLK